MEKGQSKEEREWKAETGESEEGRMERRDVANVGGEGKPCTMLGAGKQTMQPSHSPCRGRSGRRTSIELREGPRRNAMYDLVSPFNSLYLAKQRKVFVGRSARCVCVSKGVEGSKVGGTFHSFTGSQVCVTGSHFAVALFLLCATHYSQGGMDGHQTDDQLK